MSILDFIIKFVDINPWISFFIIILISQIIYGIFFRLPNRIIRHHNISKFGWPPEHLDADGDFKEEKE